MMDCNGTVITTDYYKKYVGMIRQAAWKATKVCSETYDELFSRGNLLFCEAVKSWNPEKGAFSTHLGWKLLTLKQTASEMYSPSNGGDKQLWCSLEAATVGKDGDEISSDPLEASSEYSKKMEETMESSEWEDRIPDFRRYMESMDEDCRQLCKDILDGVFDDTGYTLSRSQYIRHMSKIPTSRFYSKRYIKLGWSKQRTQNALENLRQICRQWMTDKLPCKIEKINTNIQEALF